MRLILAVGLGLGLLALAAWAWWPAADPPGPDPEPDPAPVVDLRRTFDTPFQNVRPDVKYVGDAACVGCHQELADSFKQHPMGRVLAPVAEATPLERYGLLSFNPFPAPGLAYGVVRRDGRVFHREWVPGPDGKPLAVVEAEVQFAIGSGTRARNYLLSRDGYLFQSPITWYQHGGRWDLAPSYEVRNQHFNRAVAPACLFCHSNQVDHVPGTLNRYRPPIFHGLAIGCERCHGPGELHVRARSAGEPVTGVDHTIVNPARLEHSLREAVCQQCHIEGEQRVVGRGREEFDFRPGLPLHPFLMDFMHGADTGGEVKFVNSVEQMTASRCYADSREPNKLGCISCHDPHRYPTGAEKVAHFRARCLKCHTDQSCSLPVATRRQQQTDDSCVACHMPATGSEVNHTAITDHRIPRRPGKPTPVGATRRSTPGPGDLVPFHRALIPPGDPEADRNFGLAVLAMLGRGPPEHIARVYAEQALPLLDRAVRRDRLDWPAWEARGLALSVLGRRDEAAAAYETVLVARPDAETALLGAGTVALAMNKPDEARGYFERAARINPWDPEYYHGLAVASFRRGEWGRAANECRQALRLDPTRTGTRSLLIQSYLWDGLRDRATAEYQVLRLMTPEDRRPRLAVWWDEEVARARRGY